MALQFSDYFWGKDSFEVLSNHLGKGKETLKIFSAVMTERSNAEKRYVQGLESTLKLAAKLADYPGFQEGFDLIRRSLEDTIIIHSALIPTLKDELGAFVLSYKEELKKKRKFTYTESQKQMNEMKTMETTHAKFKEKYFKLSKEFETSQNAYNDPQRKKKSTKEQLKMGQRYQKSQIEMERAELEYQENYEKFASFIPSWETKITSLLADFQKQEEERTHFLKQQGLKYGTALSQIEPIAHSTAMMASFEKVDVQAELNQYISASQTSTIRPTIPEFEKYVIEAKFGSSESFGTLTNLTPPTSMPPVGMSRSSSNGAISNQVSSTPPPSSTMGSIGAKLGSRLPTLSLHSSSGSNPIPQQQTQPQPPQQESPRPICYARVLFDYVAEDPNELNLSTGQIVPIYDMDPSGWWTGRVGGRLGLLPSNYTEEVQAPR